MKIEKLPSGNYRVRKTLDGKTRSFTFDHKPSKYEVEQTISLLYTQTDKGKYKARQSFRDSAKEFISIKENVLSPSTVREYERKITRLSVLFLDKKVDEITAKDIQKELNMYAENHSPKTVRDTNAFISSVLSFSGIKINEPILLPQKIKKEPYLPSDEDIKVIVECAKGTIFEAAIGLALCGLRRSEIACITKDDIKGNEVYVNKALVQDRNKKWVEKTTKTYESTRYVPIPKDLKDLIMKQGYAYDGGMQSISNWLKRTQKQHDMQEFSLHKLRHYFASKMFALGYSIREIEYLGGWEKNSQVLQEIYSQRMLSSTKEGRAGMMNSYFDTIN